MQVGDIIDGRYELVEEIAEGGMGKVFKACNRRTGIWVALKCLKVALAKDEEYVERFIREAKAAAAIGSEHFVAVLDAWDKDSNAEPFLVMEYLEGEPLDQVLAGGVRLDPRRAVSITLQACRALVLAHEKKLVHRDLKPANLFLTRRAGVEWLKILDLGIAKDLDMTFTTVGKAGLGTPLYMPWEQHQDPARVDIRADIYSLGAVLYEMLVGRVPFSAATYMMLLLRLQNPAPPETPRSLRPNLSEELSALVMKAIARSPDDRFQSMAEFAAALESVVESSSSPPQSTQPPRPPLIPTRPVIVPPTHVQNQPGGQAHRAVPASGRIEVFLPRGVKAELVAVEHGSFTMGSPGTEAGRYSYEVPHLVNLTHPFLLWPTPVTQDQFEALMGFNPSGAGSGPRLPVETVSWFEAVAFCNALSRKQQLDESYRIFDVKGTPGDKDYQFNVEWKGLTHPGYRLPTEAEWEYACRAGTTTATYNGDLREGLLEKEQPNPILDPIAWFYGNSGTGTHPVGELEANAWGLNDMLGNVYEWIWDWYGSYPSGAVADPSGPEGGSDRVFRGGSWSDYARLCRAADRYRLSSGCRDRYLGFRPARSRP